MAAKDRRSQAFRPGTQNNHRTYFKTYIMFCAHYKLQDLNPSVDTLCAYIEFLASCLQSHKSVRNYVSGVHLMHKYLQVSAPAFDSFQVFLMLRATRITMVHYSTPVLPITPSILAQLCKACHSLGSVASVYRCLFLFAFFSFLRRSNLLLDSMCSFDITRHTCRGDVMTHSPGLVMVIRWTKTLQTHDRVLLIPLPKVTKHLMCPVRAFRQMVSAFPAPKNGPLFQVPGPLGLCPLTISRASKTFKALIQAIGLNPQFYTFKSFHIGGASLAAGSGLTLSQVKTHGDWQSEAFWTYVCPSFHSKAQVATTLAGACL